MENNLITIEGFVVPTPSEYEANTSTVVDSARNVSGYVIGTVIRDDVAKISLKWNALLPEQWAALLQQFDPTYGHSFYRNVTFLNQTSNDFTTRQMYVSDRKASMFLLKENGLPSRYLNCSLSLVEV